MKTLLRCIFTVFAAVILFSCNRTENEVPHIRRVVLMYAAAYSNLSPSIAEDVKEMCEGAIPSAGSGDVFLVYGHFTKKNGDYSTPTNPLLIRAYKDLDGKVKKDTLVVYPETDISSSAEVFHKVLSDVKEYFPASSYGLIFSSHATGWLPAGFSDPDYILFSTSGSHEVYPLTKCLGTENAKPSGIDIQDMADAIPMKLDFFLMDACLMGCVEVAYELRDKCRFLAFSPTEILSNGFIYSSMASHI
ncbi:MAG: hypothetical protein J5835_00385, partial [Bacteroidales bacterium]|nr:hypothetical protein [Bacteroidales bacterium]